ncbi:MAG: hypothetical protein WBG69_05675 [Arcobacteraceae bacterium]
MTQDISITQTKDQLISQWKNLRFRFFNIHREDTEKFKKLYENHPLYNSVSKHFDKSFRDINQIAELEITLHLEKS